MQQKKDTTLRRPSSAERENSTTRARANENTTSHDPSPRADYERLAEALLLMTDLEIERAGPRLDITQDRAARPAFVEPRVLTRALDAHLLATFHAVDWYSPEALRGLYVEMRLLSDEQHARRQAGTTAEREQNEHSPEPADQTSQEWRDWKVKQFEQAVEHRVDDRAAYDLAWQEYEALLRGLIADDNFWHVSFATKLLPHLLDARQEIAEWI